MVGNEYARGVADALIRQLENGTAPWQKPWKPGERFMPYNPATGSEYRGMNAVWLLSVADLRGYGDARWLTYKQGESQGAQVRKGERGTPVQYWKFRETKPVNDEQGRPVLDETGAPKRVTVELERPRVFSAAVFNAAQIDGLRPPAERPALPEWERHARAEAILVASGVPISHERGDQAFYRPTLDRITLPERSQFATADGYYAIALHELGHATGHKSRLGRDLSHHFGSEGYAKEELRAEIASLMLGEQLSIGHDPGQHAAYVKSWIKALRNDPQEIFRAAADAERIARYVRGWDPAETVAEVAQHGGALRPEVSAEPKSPGNAATVGSERVYLAVPYPEKDEAKALGARWDREKKSWYAPPGTDQAPLAKWTADRAAPPARVETDPREEFGRALREAGLRVSGEPVMDGQLRRVPVEGDGKGERSGAYVGFADGHPAGYINNYRTGSEQRWKSEHHAAPVDPGDRARQANDASEHQQARAAEREGEFRATVSAVAAHLAAAEPAPADQPYLVRKEVGAHGVLIDTTGPLAVPPGAAEPQHWSKPGNLLVPVRDLDGNLMGAQSIEPDGRKSFPRGGHVAGGNHLIGDLAGSGPILIAEGYATGATLHEATRLPVAVAFNAGNLEAVAQAYRERYPDRILIVAGDNDHRKPLETGLDGQPKRNVGKEKAEAAAAAVGGAVLLPAFERQDRGSDWNDLRRIKGQAEFLRQLRDGLAAARRQTPADQPDPEAGYWRSVAQAGRGSARAVAANAPSREEEPRRRHGAGR
jgi:putative DNA primase/helicase